VLPAEAGAAGKDTAHDPPAPILQSGAGFDHHAGTSAEEHERMTDAAQEC